MNAFLTLTMGGSTILVNYFNALSFTEVNDKTLVLLAPGEQIVVDQSLVEITTMIQKKAVWDK